MTDAKKSDKRNKELFRRWLDLELNMDNEDELLGGELAPFLQKNPNTQVLLIAYDGPHKKGAGLEEAERVKDRLSEFDIKFDPKYTKIEDGGKGEGWGIDIQVLRR